MYYKLGQAFVTNWDSFVLLEIKAKAVTNWGSLIRATVITKGQPLQIGAKFMTKWRVQKNNGGCAGVEHDCPPPFPLSALLGFLIDMLTKNVGFCSIFEFPCLLLSLCWNLNV